MDLAWHFILCAGNNEIVCGMFRKQQVDAFVMIRTFKRIKSPCCGCRW